MLLGDESLGYLKFPGSIWVGPCKTDLLGRQLVHSSTTLQVLENSTLQHSGIQLRENTAKFG